MLRRARAKTSWSFAFALATSLNNGAVEATLASAKIRRVLPTRCTSAPPRTCPTKTRRRSGEGPRTPTRRQPCRILPPMYPATGRHRATTAESSMIAEMSHLRTRNSRMCWRTAAQRRELLDHVIVLGKRHLLRLVRQHVAYYKTDRPHMSLGGDSPVSRNVEPPTAGKVYRASTPRRTAAPLLEGRALVSHQFLVTTAARQGVTPAGARFAKQRASSIG